MGLFGELFKINVEAVADSIYAASKPNKWVISDPKTGEQKVFKKYPGGIRTKTDAELPTWKEKHALKRLGAYDNN
jgi:hypothetical protein